MSAWWTLQHMFIASVEKVTLSIQMTVNIKFIHIRRRCTFKFGYCILDEFLSGGVSKQIIPWSSCDSSFHLAKIICRLNNFHVTCARAVYCISFIVVVMERLHVIFKYPHADVYPVDWKLWNNDNTHYLVLLLQVMPSYYSECAYLWKETIHFYPRFFIGSTYQRNIMVNFWGRGCISSESLCSSTFQWVELTPHLVSLI